MDQVDGNSDSREVKFTSEELLEQNKSLTEELTQCRADKDFVWTLWKRLQADKPDISSAVSMVIVREQEKAEAKDKKVLAILQEKDNNIRILEEIAADLEVQLKQSMERLSGLLVERTEWEGKIDDMKKAVDKLKEENAYQQEVMKAREVQNENDQKGHLVKIGDLETLNKELKVRVGNLEEEINKLSKEKSTSATLMEANTVLRDKVKILEKDLELTKREHDERISTLQSRERQLLAETMNANEQLEDIEQKDAEIAGLSSELKKSKYEHEGCLNHIQEQNEIIKNLQLLQDETQHVLKNQQESHKSEVKSYKGVIALKIKGIFKLAENIFDGSDVKWDKSKPEVRNNCEHSCCLKLSNSQSSPVLSCETGLIRKSKTLNDLRVKCLSLQSMNEKLYGDTEALRQNLSFRQRENTEKEVEIEELRHSLTQKYNGFDSETQTVDLDCSRCRDLEERLEDTKEELDSMKDVVHNRGRRISSLEKVLSENRKKSMELKERGTDFDNEYSDEVEVKAGFRSQIESLKREVMDLNSLLSLKDNELQETKKAHSRRLRRYKVLRENYTIVAKQLRTFEQESPAAINEISLRADPKSLQQENSDSVWNELAFYRKHYQILKKEREEFEEQLDSLRVENAENNASVKEVEIQLQREQNECSRLRNEIQSRAKFVSPSKLYSTETQVEIWRQKAKQLERQNETLAAENEALNQRERYYKKEIVNLSDEIDHIHKNIKEKIDAEVQASEAIEALEKQANKSLDRIANTITDRKLELIEQYIQTSPTSPIRRRSPKRPISQSTQSTQTMNTQSSSEDEFSSSQKGNQSAFKQRKYRHEGNGNNGKTDALSLDDLHVPRRRKERINKMLSPITIGKVQKRRKFPPKSSPAAREQTSLKVRILSLQQQVDVLRSAKSRLNVELQEQTELNATIKGELETAVKKLEINKSSIQRLSDEVQRCNRDRAEFVNELERERKKSKPSEVGYKEMENRWKLATTECSKLSFQVKTLRGENDMMTAKQREFQERIIWLERQLNQKKQLLQDHKEKLKEMMQGAAKKKEDLDEVKRKNKALLLNEEQKKQYIDDLRNKINQVSLEKLNMKQQFQECQEELKRKSHLLQQSQDLCSHAEAAVNEMEKAAFDQLHEQATEQEKFHATLRNNLNKERKRITEYQWVVKNFVEMVLKDAHRLRVRIFERERLKKEAEKRRQKSQASMKEARDIACSILDMTSDDIEALLEDDHELETLSGNNDNDIRDRLKDVFASTEKFSKLLLKLLTDLVDQNWKLRLQEHLDLHQSQELFGKG